MDLNCVVCSTKYKRYGKLAPLSRYCSMACKGKYQSTEKLGEKSPQWRGGERVKPCKHCGKAINWYEMRKLPLSVFRAKKFCSKQCVVAGQKRYKGKDHPNWSGGVKYRDKYRQGLWSKAILKRDDYTCRHCGKRGGDLHAHHVKGFLDNPKTRWDIENGITLCVPCHYKTYKFYRNQFTANM